MKLTWKYPTAIVVLATTGLAARVAWSTTKCTDYPCNTPKACELTNYALQKSAFLEMFSDTALANAYADSRQTMAGGHADRPGEAFAAAIQAALDKDTFPQPKCDGDPDVADGMAMATGEDCATSATVSSNGKQRVMPGAPAGKPWNPDLDKLKTCSEMVKAAEAHEAYHRQVCQSRGAAKGLTQYVADDVAAYRAELASLAADRDKGKFQCSPTRKDIDAAVKFLTDAVKAATDQNTADNAARKPPPGSAPRGGPPPEDPAAAAKAAAAKKAWDDQVAKDAAAAAPKKGWWD